MNASQKKKHLSQAMVFLILFGVVSLFSDMTHEGASSIRERICPLWALPPVRLAFSPAWEN